MKTRTPLFILLALIPTPAFAAGAAQVAEGSQLTLFALGIAGVLLGRAMSKRGSGED